MNIPAPASCANAPRGSRRKPARAVPSSSRRCAAGGSRAEAPSVALEPLEDRYWCATGALAALSALAYDAIPDLPLAPQSDEPKKADFILEGRQDFVPCCCCRRSPRLANLFARHTDQVTVVGLGRTIAAVFGRIDGAGDDRARTPRDGTRISRLPPVCWRQHGRPVRGACPRSHRPSLRPGAEAVAGRPRGPPASSALSPCQPPSSRLRSPIPLLNDTRSVVDRVRAALDGRDAVDWYATFPAYGHYPSAERSRRFRPNTS